jgi:hypothetical protein
MARERITGGISGKGGSNVNPIYRPFKAVGEAVSRYMENTSEANEQARLAAQKYGRPSPEFKKAQDNYQGAVFQNRKPPKRKPYSSL